MMRDSILGHYADLPHLTRDFLSCRLFSSTKASG
jgi:hypothetical protein